MPFGRVYGTRDVGNEFGAVIFEAKNTDDQSTANRITQLSDHGEIWGIDGFTLQEHKTVPFIEIFYANRLAGYMQFAKEFLGVTSPVTAHSAPRCKVVMNPTQRCETMA